MQTHVGIVFVRYDSMIMIGNARLTVSHSRVVRRSHKHYIRLERSKTFTTAGNARARYSAIRTCTAYVGRPILIKLMSRIHYLFCARWQLSMHGDLFVATRARPRSRQMICRKGRKSDRRPTLTYERAACRTVQVLVPCVLFSAAVGL